jgi:hypothetical protein
MNDKRSKLVTAFLSVPLVAGAGLLTLSAAGFADWSERHRGNHDWWPSASGEATPDLDPTYTSECGSCHLAYPPRFLPARSWERILSGLAEHFGDNAELPGAQVGVLRAYLGANAGDRSRNARSGSFAASVPSDTVPLRITETPYFRREHHEIPAFMVQNNDRVLSFANCQACHRGAETGFYDDDRVVIPGYPHWDD